MNYQIFDYNCYDYQLWNLKGAGLFRGPDPRPLADDGYVCCLGAAATFGRFSELSYPQMLTDLTGIKTVNLGVSAAGPQYFLENPELIEIANRSKIIVLEVLSARSCSTNRYTSIGGKNIFIDSQSGNKVHERDIYPPLFEKGELESAEALIEEARQTWVTQMTSLISKFTKPCILLWNSKRAPDFKQNKKAYGGYVGKYPQMVNQEMLDNVSHLVQQVIYSYDVDDPITVFNSKFFGDSQQCRVGHSLRNEWGYYPSKYLLFKTAQSVAQALSSEKDERENYSLDDLEAKYRSKFLTHQWRVEKAINFMTGACINLSLKLGYAINNSELLDLAENEVDVLMVNRNNNADHEKLKDYSFCIYVPSLDIGISVKNEYVERFNLQIKALSSNIALPYYKIDENISSLPIILNEQFTCDPFSIQAV